MKSHDQLYDAVDTTTTSDSSTPQDPPNSKSPLLSLPPEVPQDGAAHIAPDASTTASYSLLQSRIMSVVVATLYCSGLVCSTSLMPQYMVHRLSSDSGTPEADNLSSSACDVSNSSNTSEADAIQAEASERILHYTLASGIPSLFVCLIVGGYADVIGRRPLLLLCVFTGFVKMTLTTMIIRFDLPMWFFYVGYGLDGLSGSWTMLFIMLVSSIADTNKEKKDRAFWVALLEGCMSIITAVFLVVMGYILDVLGFFAASLIGAATVFLGFALGVCLLPETLPRAAPGEKRQLKLFGGVRRILDYFLLTGSGRARLVLWTCLGIFMFSVVCQLCVLTIDSLYLLHRPFCWTHFNIGLYSGARMVISVVVGMSLLRITRACCQPEILAMVGLAFLAAGFALEAEAKTAWQIILVPVVCAPGSVAVPIVRAILSSLASPADQGAVNSSVAVVEVIINLVGSSGVLSVYSATLAGPLPGAVYLLLAAFCTVGILLYLVYFKLRTPDTRHNYEKIVNSE